MGKELEEADEGQDSGKERARVIFGAEGKGTLSQFGRG